MRSLSHPFFIFEFHRAVSRCADFSTQKVPVDALPSHCPPTHSTSPPLSQSSPVPAPARMPSTTNYPLAEVEHEPHHHRRVSQPHRATSAFIPGAQPTQESSSSSTSNEHTYNGGDVELLEDELYPKDSYYKGTYWADLPRAGAFFPPLSFASSSRIQRGLPAFLAVVFFFPSSPRASKVGHLAVEPGGQA